MPRAGRAPAPRYSHRLEVMDGAAALSMAIAQAEAALMDPTLGPEDREMLESVLHASRERFAHVVALLVHPGSEGVEAHAGEPEGASLSGPRLLEAARMAEEGSSAAEHEAVRAIDRLGRSLDVGARDVLETFLGHPSPVLRANAMKVLALHWRLREYTEHVLWSLASDEDVDCRRAAALCLGSLYEGTRDRGIGTELAAALARQGEEECVRWACYHALVSVDGRRVADMPVGRYEPDRADAGLLEAYRPAEESYSA
ncbi:MAG TPA: hypothetical protein VJV23_09660 [Candidatus Polarisedimenticolia bacterium]|nr:hypothetical protein [Candidatus Polarisedimenticolia bacterium]